MAATSIGSLFVDMFANTGRFHTDMDKARNKARTTATEIKSSFERIGEIALGVGLGNAFERLGRGAVDLVKDMAKLGLEAKVQEDAFARLSESVGASGEALANALKAASGDIINTSDVMLAAARGLREGFAPEQLVKLMEVARQQSKLAGTDVTTAFNDITQAIANQQSRALKQFGIVVDIDNVTKEYAATLGRTAEELTSIGRAQAIYRAVIQQTAGATAALTTAQLTQSEQLQQLSGQWKQFKEDMGKVLVDTGFAVLEWAQSLGHELGRNLPAQLEAMQKIWTGVWKDAVAAMNPVASMLKDTLIPALKGGAIAASALGLGITAGFSVIAGPLAYISSILDDLSRNKWPSHTRATVEANSAVAESRVRVAEAIESFQKLQNTETGVTVTTKETSKAIGNLGKNTLGALTNQVKPVAAEFDRLSQAMRALSEQAAEGGMSDFDAGIARLTRGVFEAAAATKHLSPELRKVFEDWARGVAGIIVLQADEKKLAEEVVAAIEGATTSVQQDLQDEAEAWGKVAVAMHDATLVAEVTGDTTGGVAEKIKFLEDLLPGLIKRFGAGSEQVAAFRARLQELKTTAAGFAFSGVDFETPTGATKDLLDAADIWGRYGLAVDQARAASLATGDAVGLVAAKVQAASALVAEAASRFGEGSEEFLAAKARFMEVRDAFDATSITEAFRVIDVQTQAFGSSFDPIPAKIEAIRAAINAMAREAEPNAEAMKALSEQLNSLTQLNDGMNLLRNSALLVGDAFIDMALDGKKSFGEMAEAVIKAITRMILQMLILKAVEAGISVLGGGLGGGIGGGGSVGVAGGIGTSDIVRGAKGGIIKPRPGGQLVIAGEAGQPEALIPLDRMGQLSGGGGGSTIIINNYGNDEVKASTHQGGDGREIIEIVIGAVDGAIAGGRFDKANRSRYGITPTQAGR